MTRYFIFCVLLSVMGPIRAQQPARDVYTSDIDNFWIAYDSVQTTSDSVKQTAFIQKLYVDKGTEGLKTFMKVRSYTPELWARVIRQYPKFWRSIRQNMSVVPQREAEATQYLKKFKALYPDYQEAKIYYTVGALKSGGTAEGKTLLVGMEIAAGNNTTDVSEFPNKRLENLFKTIKTDNIVPFTIHEYMHTQQKEEGKTLLGQALCEGVCDFLTELVLDRPLTHPYLQYGREHETEIKARFKKEMYNADYSQWIYNSSTSQGIGDLGYFMGYTICKSYYQHAANKKQAIREMIELPYSDATAISQFLARSKYFIVP